MGKVCPMHSTLTAHWVTIHTAPGCTADQRILARSHWAAWWLGCQLFGQHNVTMVRKVP
jgi:hypothetical protein